MRRRFWALGFVGVLLFGSGYLMAQKSLRITDDPQEVAEALVQAEKRQSDNHQAATEAVPNGRAAGDAEAQAVIDNAAAVQTQNLYRKAIEDPRATLWFAHYCQAYYYEGLRNAKTAAQITQVGNEASVRLQSMQVVQNARIIELLQRIAAKK